ncbi:HEAT repeat (plasmid) [Euzebya pacifica]|uniref:HEAT repeat n=1 Tax=Euzebya pacifica TaxID=1608957 RepID=A0A346Y665_9ACTN|nr:HEAT repeat [Euzebya pacifica]
MAEAANTNDPDRIEALVGDRSVEVRRALMGRPAGSLPEWAVTALAADDDRAVRRGIALRHPLTGPVAARLAADPSAAVRSALARRTDIDPALVIGLAFDPDPTVRAVAVLNPLLPDDDFDRIVEPELSAEVWVSMVARRATKAATVRMLLERSNEPRLWEMAVRRADLPADLVAVAAQSLDAGVRTVVAGRDDLPDELVTALLCDPVPSARRAVLAGPSPIGDGHLRNLLNDDDDTIRVLALQRLQTTQDAADLLGTTLSVAVRVELAQTVAPDDAAVPMLATDANRKVRSALAGRSDLHRFDPAVIVGLAADRSYRVRAILAGRVPLDAAPQVLIDLATDPREEVVEALAGRRGLPDVAVVALVAAGRTR